jgi:peroxiredoxin
MALQAGQKAPDFTLIDTEKKERSLREFHGKTTILAFFPGAFTGVCTKELCALRDAMANFNTMNARVVGVSVDSPFANKAFAQQNQLGFPLLSDFTHVVSRQYAGVYPEFSGVKGYEAAKRAVFVIDPEGVIRYAWVTENPGVEPKYDEVREAAAAL